jgi:hypothetical protein
MMQSDTAEKWHHFKLADAAITVTEQGTNPLSWKLLQGDCRTILPQLPKESVNCVVTSPPYYWQRDYGVDGQMGLEATIDGYVENLRETFRGLKRVLAKDGTVFLNLGDTYYSGKGQPRGTDRKHKARRFGLRAVDASGLGVPRKSLIGMPWRVALALIEDGWLLRNSLGAQISHPRALSTRSSLAQV